MICENNFAKLTNEVIALEALIRESFSLFFANVFFFFSYIFIAHTRVV